MGKVKTFQLVGLYTVLYINQYRGFNSTRSGYVEILFHMSNDL